MGEIGSCCVYFNAQNSQATGVMEVRCRTHLSLQLRFVAHAVGQAHGSDVSRLLGQGNGDLTEDLPGEVAQLIPVNAGEHAQW